MEQAFWILEHLGDKKFPYRLTIKKGDEVLLALRVQDRWPGQKGNIFCIREETVQWETIEGEEIERVPVLSIKRFGKRLSIVLDRTINKRCDFLFLKKKYKTKEGEYEQIFWRTQKGLRERKPKVKLTTYYSGSINIVVDTSERYPWKFPNCNVSRKKLPVGDYALMDGERILAVVERKTFENVISEFGNMSALHQQLQELSVYPHSAIVIEANYSDFLNPDKIKFYSSSFSAKAIGEISALHPGLNIVFAGNRKLAREWTYRFFTAIMAHNMDTPEMKVAEVVEKYGKPAVSTGGQYYEIKREIKTNFPVTFTRSMIKERFPETPETTITRVLLDLKRSGFIRCEGRGKSSYWIKEG